MAELDITKTEYTDMRTKVEDYSVSSKTIDEAVQKETYYDNPNFKKYLGYFKQIPELQQAIKALAVWTAGKGFTTDNRTQAVLSNITGWGEDSFESIMQNMLIIKKINGDAYAEIIRNNKGTLINLKPLNPSRMRTVVNSKGRIIRYEEYDSEKKEAKRKFRPDEILHLVNDRVANEIHGTSVIEACQWVIDARNEAMADFRRILHRSTIRIMEVDEDDTSRLSNLKKDYAEAINKGELLIVPKGTVTPPVEMSPPQTQHLETIRYYENFFYQAVGIPKIILGGSAEYTEASSKIGYLTFEQVYMTEQRLLEDDLWNQLAIKIKFERPVSLKESLVKSEAANTGQVGFQPNELKPQVTRNE